MKILIPLLVGLHGIQGDLVCGKKEGDDVFGKGSLGFVKLIAPEDNLGRVNIGGDWGNAGAIKKTAMRADNKMGGERAQRPMLLAFVFLIKALGAY